MANQSASKHLISLTAYLAAAARAHESEREDRLFDDPWASLLTNGDGLRRFRQLEDQGAAIVVRTRYFDECVQRLAHEEGLRQMVLPAAGLDTRAFRLHWPPQMRVFELDQPHVLSYKEAVLNAHGAQPACQRCALAVDLTDPGWQDALLEAGFDPRQPAIWLVEGLFFYLPAESTRSLLSQISSLSAPGSWLGFNSIQSEMLRSPLTQHRIRRAASLGSPWIGPIDDPVGLLASFGWQACCVSAAEKGFEYRRPLSPFISPEELTPAMRILYHSLITAYRSS